jgi:exodeoxyribonuclease V alpha subunit
VKIYKTYGQDSIKTVQENPYRLAKDIYGVGFLSADKVALSLGLKEDSRERLVAGIRHTLASAKEDGHCFLKFAQLLEGLTELLGITLEEARLQILLVKWK